MKNLVIVACGPGYENSPPVSGDYDIWGLNTSVYQRPCDVGFQIHPREAWNHDKSLYDDSLRAAHELGIPIYMLDIFLYSPSTAIRYPIEDIVKEFGEPYFSCSIPFMLALGILRGYRKIDIYGCTVFVDAEYAWEKPCIEYWIGMARGRGIEVVLHEPTHVCKTPTMKIYGYGMTYPELQHKVLRS